MKYWDKRGIRQCDGPARQVTEVPSLFGGFRKQRECDFYPPAIQNPVS